MMISKTLRKLRDGETVFCQKDLYADPDIVELMGHLGVDVVWICNEHLGIDPSRLKEVLRAGRAGGADVMVRRAFGNYDDLIQPLEMGANGLMIPHCLSAEMAKEIVRQTRFYPLGARGVDGVNADSLFGTVPFAQYIAEANRSTFIMAQIEDPEAIDQIEDIAAVDGIDLLFVGPADLSHALGCAGDLKNPRVRKVIDRAVSACDRHGKWCGTPGLDEAYIKSLLDQGVRFITWGSDYGILKTGLQELLAKCEAFKHVPVR